MTTAEKHIKIPESVTEKEILSGHTTLKLGGPTDYFASPESMDQLHGVLAWIRRQNLAFMVIGGGSNLLFSDAGYRGVVISLKNMSKEIEVSRGSDKEDILVRVPAGVKLPVLCSRAAREGFSGLLFASGIPGTVGGALMMNAGTHDGAIGDVLESVTAVLPDGEAVTFEKERLLPSYRKMDFKDSPCPVQEMIFTECTMVLKKGDSGEIARAIAMRQEKRKSIQPLGTFNAGSFFKNPENGPSAGALIDSAGLKGSSVGGAMVSEKHANFLVNTGNATSCEMLKLMARVQSTVMEKFGVFLEPEVKIIG